MAAVAHHFPWTARVAGTEISFRLMTPGDRDEVRQFVSSLPEEDLFFLMDDPRDPAGMERWVTRISEGLSISVLAEIVRHTDRLRDAPARRHDLDPASRRDPADDFCRLIAEKDWANFWRKKYSPWPTI